MKRTYLTLIVLMLVIGFAAVTTNLVINGTVNIGFNEDEFNVYFSYASIDYEEKQSIISTDKKTIAFETKKLTDAGNESVLTYDVTNESKQYNAKVKVTCDEGTDLYSIENSLKEETIEARSTKTGKLKVTLNNVVTEEQDIKFECHLEVTAVSRSEEKTNEIPELCHYLDETYPVGYEWKYDYTGEEQEFTVPCNGTYKIELWGASGGCYSPGATSCKGGKGAYVAGNLNLNKDKNKKIYVYVGQLGLYEKINKTQYDANSYSKYSFNGGGTGNFWCLEIESTGVGPNITGGGATDLRLINGAWDNFESLKSRIMVAAGGGGGITDYGGAGGGLSGYDGKKDPREQIIGEYQGKGGTQLLGGNSLGAFGKGGAAAYSGAYCNSNDGAGGGSGYYGGGGSTGTKSLTGGNAAGGSSFISGHQGCDAINESSTETSIQHTGKATHYSGLVFTDTIMIDGEGYKWTTIKGEKANMPSHDGKTTITGNLGNGYAKITLVSLEN